MLGLYMPPPPKPPVAALETRALRHVDNFIKVLSPKAVDDSQVKVRYFGLEMCRKQRTPFG